MIKEDKEEPLEKLVYDTKMNRYKLVNLAARWVRELKTKEEYKNIPYYELVDIALYDILTGKVKLEDIEKLGPPKKPKEKEK